MRRRGQLPPVRPLDAGVRLLLDHWHFPEVTLTNLAQVRYTQAGAINTSESIFGVNSFLEGIRGADSRRPRYNDVPRAYREAPPATVPPATAPSAAATAPPATINPRVDDDEGAWEPASEDEIDPEFTVID